MSVVARQIHAVKKGTADWVTVDCRGWLAPGELLDGEPAVVPSPSGLAISQEEVNAVEVEIDGDTLAAGEAVRFFCDTAGATAQTQYTITVSCAKTGSTAPLRLGELNLKVVA